MPITEVFPVVTITLMGLYIANKNALLMQQKLKQTELLRQKK